MNRKQIENTIDALSRSQGFYGRLKRDLEETDEDTREKFFAKFSDCKDPVDFILALEG